MNKIINQDPYGGLICRWFQEKFSKEIHTNKEDLLEILADLIFSTKENRVGPIPSPEHQVVVRDVIRQAIALNAPIPVLVPWGGRKAQIHTSPRLDMAEVSGLYQIVDLDATIRRHYSPGLHVNIRIEDINANWLYRHEPDIAAMTERYSADFLKLINMLKGDTHIIPLRESMMKDGKWSINTKPVFPPGWNEKEKQTGPSQGRSYSWFAVLADVRNGGYNGEPKRFTAISEPKGVPEDATEEWKEYVDQWGYDLHSISFLSVPDFDNFDWNQVATFRAYISLDQYKELRESKGVPSSYAGGVSGLDIINISMEDADKHLETPNPEYKGKKAFVLYTWNVIYEEVIGGYKEEYVEPMRELLKEYEDVRLVFGFDN